MDGPLFIGSGECKYRSIFGENGMVTLADPGGCRVWLPPIPYFFPALPFSATPVSPHGTYILDPPPMRILDPPMCKTKSEMPDVPNI